MPIPEEITKKIDEFSLSKNPNEMVSYLKEKLKEKTINAEDLLDYAKTYYWTDSKNHVINASIINKLGVAVSSLEDEQKKLASKYYKLAAERGSSWGNRNYAQCLLSGSHGVKKSKKEALVYAKKAVELSEKDLNEKHEHKYILYQALETNNFAQEANVALIEYLKFKSGKVKNGKNLDEKVKKEIEIALKAYENYIRNLSIELNENPNVSEEIYKAKLDELQPLLEGNIGYAGYDLYQQHAYYVQGGIYENLGESSKAMLAYCKITNKKSPLYQEAVTARAELLKQQVTKSLKEKTESDGTDTHMTDVESNEKSIMLPNDLTLPINFRTYWKANTEWFHSVEESELKESYDKRLKQLEKLISAKKEEISLVKELIEDISENTDTKSRLEAKKEELEADLANLKNAEIKLKSKLQEHLPSTRVTLRRYGAESHFFNPMRSKKKEELETLTHEIINQRFSVNATTDSSIQLNGKSTRLLITAERVFQEAVIALTDKNTPSLGIPIAREKSWSMGWGYDQRSGATSYGPIEQYAVDKTIIQSEHRTDPKRPRLGDSFLPQHGTYTKDICPFLAKLSEDDQEKEKQLASFLIRYGRTHQGISLEELQAIYKEADNEDVDYFNRICFLIVEKEQSQWHSALYKQYHLGMAVSQARCLILIEAGYIGFKEAFKNDVLFGVYSKTGIVDNPDKVAEACKFIDDLYMSYLHHIHPGEHVQLLKQNIAKKAESLFQESYTFLKNSASVCLPTREQAHQDMKYVYGGESDSDGEGYDSELEI